MKSKSLLSPRLQLAARFCTGARLLCDVGTDHGYLPVSLLESGEVLAAVASDIRPGPLTCAKRHALEAGLEDKIRFELCDGLDFPGAESCDTVVCAGMGGETIAGILSRAPWTKRGTGLVLQPQSKYDELCEWLYGNGYAITDAACAAEGERLYAVLNVRGGVPEFRYVEDALLAARDPLLPAWLDVRLNRLRRALAGMERGSDAASEAEAARAAIARLLKCKEAVQ